MVMTGIPEGRKGIHCIDNAWPFILKWGLGISSPGGYGNEALATHTCQARTCIWKRCQVVVCTCTWEVHWSTINKPANALLQSYPLHSLVLWRWKLSLVLVWGTYEILRKGIRPGVEYSSDTQVLTHLSEMDGAILHIDSVPKLICLTWRQPADINNRMATSKRARQRQVHNDTSGGMCRKDRCGGYREGRCGRCRQDIYGRCREDRCDGCRGAGGVGAERTDVVGAGEQVWWLQWEVNSCLCL